MANQQVTRLGQKTNPASIHCFDWLACRLASPTDCRSDQTSIRRCQQDYLEHRPALRHRSCRLFHQLPAHPSCRPAYRPGPHRLTGRLLHPQVAIPNAESSRTEFVACRSFRLGLKHLVCRYFESRPGGLFGRRLRLSICFADRPLVASRRWGMFLAFQRCRQHRYDAHPVRPMLPARTQAFLFAHPMERHSPSCWRECGMMRRRAAATPSDDSRTPFARRREAIFRGSPLTAGRAPPVRPAR